MTASSRVKDLIRGGLQTCLGPGRYLYWYARWSLRRTVLTDREPDLMALLAQIPEDGVALDIGACLGATTVPMARHLRRGVVHSFEPHPLNRSVLERILVREGAENVRVHGVAAGERSGRVRMVMPTGSGARLFGLTHVLHDSITTFNDGEEVEVEQVVLDDYLRLAPGERITAVKVDVENYERFVLRGCRRILTEHRPVVLCELWNNDNRTDVMALLDGLGYACRVLRDGRLVPFDRAVDAETLNYFFVPAEWIVDPEVAGRAREPTSGSAW
jgi:FkbM family methyltransferase